SSSNGTFGDASSCSFPDSSKATTIGCSMRATAGTIWPCRSRSTRRTSDQGGSMKIKDILKRDPASHQLVNQTQARIACEQCLALDELRGELSTFVCEGQYADGVQ